MDQRSRDKIGAYLESLDSAIQELKAVLQNHPDPEQLAVASKTVVLAAAVMDDAVQRECKAGTDPSLPATEGAS